MIRAMEGVKEFYLRNSDGTFELDYVITPTVTMSLPKWKKVQRATPFAEGDENAIPIFLIQQVVFTTFLSYIIRIHIYPFGEVCKLAAQMSRIMTSRPAFSGVFSVQINTPRVLC